MSSYAAEPLFISARGDRIMAARLGQIHDLFQQGFGARDLRKRSQKKVIHWSGASRWTVTHWWWEWRWHRHRASGWRNADVAEEVEDGNERDETSVTGDVSTDGSSSWLTFPLVSFLDYYVCGLAWLPQITGWFRHCSLPPTLRAPFGCFFTFIRLWKGIFIQTTVVLP